MRRLFHLWLAGQPPSRSSDRRFAPRQCRDRPAPLSGPPGGRGRAGGSAFAPLVSAVAFLVAGYSYSACEAAERIGSRHSVDGLSMHLLDVFIPEDSMQDFEVVFAMADASPARSFVVRRRGPWVSVGAPVGAPRGQQFVNLETDVVISFIREGHREYERLELRQATGSGRSPTAFRTGERRSVLGESCAMWQVQPTGPAPGGTSRRRLSCVTADGIELQRVVLDERGSVVDLATATSFSRSSSADDAGWPPSDLLNIATVDLSSDRSDGSGSKPSDMEVLLEGPGDARGSLIRRRHPWLYQDLREADGQRTLTISHRERPVRITAQLDRDGKPSSLVISRALGDPWSHLEPIGEESEIAGLRCTWSRGGLADYQQKVCRTSDGVPLAIQIAGPVDVVANYSAHRVSFRPLPPAAVRLPPILLSPSTWGLLDAK